MDQNLSQVKSNEVGGRRHTVLLCPHRIFINVTQHKYQIIAQLHTKTQIGLIVHILLLEEMSNKSVSLTELITLKLKLNLILIL